MLGILGPGDKPAHLLATGQGMKPRDIASLAYKLAGIYALIHAAVHLSSLLPLLAMSPDPFELAAIEINFPLLAAGHLIPFIVLVALGSILILDSRRFARITVRDEPGSGEGVQPVQLHAILFSVAGVMIIALAAPSIPRTLSDLAVILSDYGTLGSKERRTEWLVTNWHWATGVALQLALGVGLLFWGRRLAKRFHRPPPPAHPIESRMHCPRCDHPFDPSDYRSDALTRWCANCNQDLPADLFAPAEDDAENPPGG